MPLAASPEAVAKMAETYMRETGSPIREMPIVQRAAPSAGPLAGRVVAVHNSHVAVATAANRFVVVELPALYINVQLGERLSLVLTNGRAALDKDRSRGR